MKSDNTTNRIIAMIPARLDSQRFPGKLLKSLGGKSIIRRTYESTVHTKLFDAVYVVTDNRKIYDEITSHGGAAIFSDTRHSCGSDRIAEAVQEMDVDIVVNVQGDEPFTAKEVLERLLLVFQNDPEKGIDLATPMIRLTDSQEIDNPNNVKVITDLQDFALYFSRSRIPFPRDDKQDVTYFKHIGIYAFRKQALIDFYHLKMQPLETAEKIECIRFLEYGKRIKMVETDELNMGIDTPEDLVKAEQLLRNKNK